MASGCAILLVLQASPEVISAFLESYTKMASEKEQRSQLRNLIAQAGSEEVSCSWAPRGAGGCRGK